MFVRAASVGGLTFALVSNSTGSPLTGATASAWISRDGTAQIAVAAATSELGNGQYVVNLSASEMTATMIGLLFRATGAVPVNYVIKTVQFNLDSATPNVNASTVSASAIGASQFAASAIDEVAFAITAASQIWRAAVRSLTDKTGYSLSASANTAAADQVWATATRTITGGSIAVNNDKTGYSVTTVGDKTGYSLSASANTAAADQVWATATRTITGGSITENNDKTGYSVATVGDKTGYSLSASANTAVADQVWANATRTITGGSIAVNNDKLGYSLSASANGVVADSVWDEPAVSHTNPGTYGLFLDMNISDLPNAPAIAAGVWDEPLSGHLGAGTTGSALQDAGAVGVTPPTASAISDEVWNRTVRTITGGLVTTNNDKTGYSLSASANVAAADQVWATAVRTITGGSVTTNNDKTGYSVTTVSDKTGYSLSASANNAVADQVWDESLASHVASGTTASALQDAGATGGTPPTASAIADEVWSRSVRAITGGSLTVNNDKTGYGVSASAIAEISAQVWLESVRSITDKAGFGLAASAITASTFGASAIDDVAFGATAASQIWRSAVRSITDKLGFSLSASANNAIADQVWDEAIAAHVATGTVASALQDAGATGGTPPTASAIADQVWITSAVRTITGGSVTANNDKTGYGLATSAVDQNTFALTAASQVWNAAVRSLTDKLGFSLSASANEAVSGQVWAETVRTVTGGSITAASVTSGNLTLGASAISACTFSASAIDGVVLAQGAADKVWSTSVPGSFGAGTAGSALASTASANSLTSETIWGYSSRTLTQSSLQLPSVLSGCSITLVRGDTFVASFTGLGSLVGRTKLWFTAKANENHADSQAIIQIEESASLLYLNGGIATASFGGIIVTDANAGNITINLRPEAASQLGQYSNKFYDVQVLRSGSVITLQQGIFNVELDVTNATS